MVFIFHLWLCQSMQMEAFAWIFCKISGVLYMTLLLYWLPFRYTLLFFFICRKNDMLGSTSNVEPCTRFTHTRSRHCSSIFYVVSRTTCVLMCRVTVGLSVSVQRRWSDLLSMVKVQSFTHIFWVEWSSFLCCDQLECVVNSSYQLYEWYCHKGEHNFLC